MPIIVALIIGFFVVENINNNSNETNSEELIKDKVTEVIEKKSDIFEVKVDPKKLEPVKEEVKPVLVKEEVKPEIIKEEVKPVLVKEEVKPVLVKEEVKPALVKELKSLEQETTNWFKLLLYAIASILTVVIGRYFYSRQRNVSSLIDSESVPANRELKAEDQTDSTEQEPALEEVQIDSTEQEPAQEEVQTDTTEQEPAQEEVQIDTTEQEPAQEEVQIDSTEQEPAQEEVQIDTTEQVSVEDDDKNKK